MGFDFSELGLAYKTRSKLEAKQLVGSIHFI
jgi:hypothetical protein